MDKTTLLLLLTSLAYTITAEESECKVITEYEGSENLCFMEVQCSSSTAQINNAISNHYCTKTERQQKMYNGYYGHYEWTDVYLRKFRINLQVDNIDFEQNTPFANLGDLKSRVVKLRLHNTKMAAVSDHMQVFTKLNEMELQTELNVIDLNKFVLYDEMVKINVSDNLIFVLEQSQENAQKVSKVTTIDLSHNRLEAIPNNYFSRFPELRHLNMSHNNLKSFDLLTFEGVLKLQTFQISNNNLTDIGNYLLRFVNLEEILLDNNMLSTIEEPNFRTMTKLRRLNVSSNMIGSIEEQSFENLILLTELDMGNNIISKVSNTWFLKNTNLQTVVLSNNKIQVIEPGVFTGKHVTNFDIRNNCLAGELQAETFAGIYTDVLDLRNGNITVISNNIFNSLFVKSLNLSSNKIAKIKAKAFIKLDMLEKIDLSMNCLNEIEFKMVKANKVSFLNANNNFIVNITESTFKNLSALTSLDLSHNLISLIEPQSFQSLGKLNTLALNNNALPKTLQANLFHGLGNLTDLNLSFTRISSFENETFSGLWKLVTLNISHSELTNISFNAFIHTRSIEILDLSHNLLQGFKINTSTIGQVKQIRLNNNLLSAVTNETFFGLLHLEALILSENNIARIYQTELMSLSQLGTLDLSYNSNLEIGGSAFNNLENIVKLTLTNVKGKIDFEHLSNSSIEILDLSECNILDIGKIFIHKLTKVENINLAKNKIRFLDKLSFRTMFSLAWLDLSNNLISNIQPGTFIHTKQISSLNLHGNLLTHLQFGVFEGLNILRTLNLSNNALHSFSVHILHDNPIIDTVILDNNVLNFDFEEFANTSVKTISIGGNPISCKSLTKLKKNFKYYGFKVVDTEVTDYISENVAGISCVSNNLSNKTWQLDVNDTNTSSMQIITAVLNTINNFRDSVEHFSKNINTSLSAIPSMVSDNSSTILKLMKDLLISNNGSLKVDKLIESNTELQQYLKNLTNTSSQSNNQAIHFYSSIMEILTNITSINDKSTIKYNSEGTNDTQDRDEHFIEKIKIINDEKDKIVIELKEIIKELKDKNNFKSSAQVSSASNAEYNGDIKGILYFIAVCFSLSIVASLSKTVYRLFFVNNKLDRGNRLHNSVCSTQPISNVIEMQ